MFFPRRDNVYLYFFLFFVVGMSIRILSASMGDLWWDEYHLLRFSTQENFNDFFRNYVSYENNQQPIYYFISYLLFKVIAPSTEFIVRFPALFFGVLSIPVMFWVMKKIFNNGVALFSVILLVFSTFHIQYSAEARPYSLVMLLCIISIYYFFMYSGEMHFRHRIKLFIVNLLIFYTFPLAIIFVGLEYIFLFIKKIYSDGKYKKNLSCYLDLFYRNFLFEFSVFTFFVILRIDSFVNRIHINWIPYPTLQDFFLAYRLFIQYGSNPNIQLVLGIVLLFILCALVDNKEFFQRFKNFYYSRIFIINFLLFIIFFIPVLVYVISRYNPIFVPRYLAPVFPPLIIIFAIILSLLSPGLKKVIVFSLLIISPLTIYYVKIPRSVDCSYDEAFELFKDSHNIIYVSDFPDMQPYFYGLKNNYNYNIKVVNDTETVINRQYNPEVDYNNFFIVTDWGKLFIKEYLPKGCTYEDDNWLRMKCINFRKIQC